MNAMHRIRRRSDRLAQLSAGLFVLVWLSLAAAPCVMAMELQQAPDHDCPHCPPAPCHEVAPDDCDEPDSLDGLRAGDSTPSVLAPPPATIPADAAPRRIATQHASRRQPPARAGPRPHLVNVQFNE